MTSALTVDDAFGGQTAWRAVEHGVLACEEQAGTAGDDRRRRVGRLWQRRAVGGLAERFAALLNGYRHALLRHRDGARLVAGTYSVMPNTLVLSEQLTSTFLAAGFSEEVATWATWHSSALVLGLVLEQQGEPEDWPQRLDHGVDVAQYPSVKVAHEHHVSGDHDARFDFSRDLLLRGLDSLLHEAERIRLDTRS